jgi:hypothetical protein
METDKCRMYVVSLILDPRMKYDYFERNWKKEWMQDMKDKMKSVWEEYGGYTIPTLAMTPSEVNEDSSFDINKWRFGSTQSLVDELTRYLDAPLLMLDTKEANDAFNAMEWWKGNMQEFPILAQIAFEIFSIPAMSVEPERVFSGYIPYFVNELIL